jgi:hypothetical protein
VAVVHLAAAYREKVREFRALAAVTGEGFGELVEGPVDVVD